MPITLVLVFNPIDCAKSEEQTIDKRHKAYGFQPVGQVIFRYCHTELI